MRRPMRQAFIKHRLRGGNPFSRELVPLPRHRRPEATRRSLFPQLFAGPFDRNQRHAKCLFDLHLGCGAVAEELAGEEPERYKAINRMTECRQWPLK